MKRELTKRIDSEEFLNSSLEWARQMILKGLKAGPVVIRLSRPTRTLDQNAKLWPMLTDVSKQVEWYGHTLTSDEWKDVFTAALKGQKTVPGIEGGFVVLGASTSKMDKEAFSDLIELIYSFGSDKGVVWSEK